MHSIVQVTVCESEIVCNLFSPGVIKTEIHKRGGMDEEAYQKVGQLTSKQSSAELCFSDICMLYTLNLIIMLSLGSMETDCVISETML